MSVLPRHRGRCRRTLADRRCSIAPAAALLVEPRLDMLTEQLMGLAGDEEAQELLMMVSDSEVSVPADGGVEM